MQHLLLGSCIASRQDGGGGDSSKVFTKLLKLARPIFAGDSRPVWDRSKAWTSTSGFRVRAERHVLGRTERQNNSC